MNIPESIVNKIMLYVSHPVADIIKNDVNRILSVMECSFEEYDITYKTMYFDIKHIPREVLDDADSFVAELSDADDEDD